MTDQTMTPDSDPADFTVPEVTDYLGRASDFERTRVLEAESAGKNRAGITGWTEPAGDAGPTDPTDEAAPLEPVSAAEALASVTEQLDREHAERQKLAGGIAVAKVERRRVTGQEAEEAQQEAQT